MSQPTPDTANAAQAVAPVLEARAVSKHFTVRRTGAGRRRGRLHAVDGVSISLYPGQITALVGESGSGKSTLARLLAHLLAPSSGELLLNGQPVRLRGPGARRRYVKNVQLVLQDPFSSFNPVHTVGYTLARATRIHHSGLSAAQVERRSVDLLAEVALAPGEQFLKKFPHELSGGQRQRAAIARPLAADPKVLLADEPVSMLDVSIRLGVLNLLKHLTTTRHLALLYITHDIASARYFAHNALVMYAGEIIERGSSEDVTQRAAHPYTQLLIASAPDPADPRHGSGVPDTGSPPTLIDPPPGCRFAARCPFAMPKCQTSPPEIELAAGHSTRCWLYDNSAESDRKRKEVRLPYHPPVR